MRLNLQLFKGGVKSGSGAETIEQYDAAISTFASDWDTMAQVDMGYLVNPFVREMQDLIHGAQESFAAGVDHSFSFTPGGAKGTGELIKHLNGFDISTNPGYDLRLLQTHGLHSGVITRKGLASFLQFLNDRGWDEYAQFARDELAKSKPKGRGRKR